ncbi:MAG: hypothetical protein K8S27_01345 [Candidatus Omnitrophica bacterium]|nr:hypothetical protein [Candidatus Omnitrophota bacterium]
MLRKFLKILCALALLFFLTKALYKGTFSFAANSWFFPWVLLPSVFCFLMGGLVFFLFITIKKVKPCHPSVMIFSTFVFIVALIKTLSFFSTQTALDFNFSGLLFFLDSVYSFEGFYLSPNAFYPPQLVFLLKILAVIFISLLIMFAVKWGMKTARFLRSNKQNKMKIAVKPVVCALVSLFVFALFFLLQEKPLVQSCQFQDQDAQIFCQMCNSFTTRNIRYCPQEPLQGESCRRMVRANGLECRLLPGSAKNKCLAFIKLDRKHCMALPSRDRKECLTMAASLRNDPGLCELLTIDQDKVDCYQKRCHLLQDPVFCQRLTAVLGTEKAVLTTQGQPPPGHYYLKDQVIVHVSLTPVDRGEEWHLSGELEVHNQSGQYVPFLDHVYASRGRSRSVSDNLIMIKGRFPRNTIAPGQSVTIQWEFQAGEQEFLLAHPGQHDYVFWVLVRNADPLSSSPVTVTIPAGAEGTRNAD